MGVSCIYRGPLCLRGGLCVSRGEVLYGGLPRVTAGQGAPVGPHPPPHTHPTLHPAAAALRAARGRPGAWLCG